MVGVPPSFPIPQETAIASYSFTNLIEGLGNVYFYAGNGLDEDANSVNFMSSAIFPSNTNDSSYHANGGDFTLLATESYALASAIFSSILTGRSIISFGWGMSANINNQGQSQGYIIVKLKANGVTIGEGKTGTKTSTGTADTFSAGSDTSASFDISSVQLKKGEILSVDFEIWGKRYSGSNGGYVVLGHDPANREGALIDPTTTNVSTQIKIQIPFKLNL